MWITKSDYLLYKECRENIWCKFNKPEVYSVKECSEFDKSIIAQGNEVEEYARKLFEKGVLIEGRGEEAIEETKEHLEKKTPVLFQPALLHDNFFAALDILEYNEKTKKYKLYEVKAKKSTVEKHIYDLAFQTHILNEYKIPLEAVGILRLNSDYVRGDALSIEDLFYFDDLTEKIKDILPQVIDEMKEMSEFFKQKTISEGCECVYKSRKKHCPTFSYHNLDIPEYGIHDISRIQGKKLATAVDSGALSFDKVIDTVPLTKIQENQVRTSIEGVSKIDSVKIKNEISGIKFPIYFLDYETSPLAVPRFKGFSPYEHVPFQFSLHTIKEDGGEIKHTEYIQSAKKDPTLDFFESLDRNIKDEGTIIVWNKKFEKNIINDRIKQRHPELVDRVNRINDMIYDLMEIFSKQLYVEPDFKGSCSIKVVLPVLVPELSYKDLAIQDGGSAAESWYRAIFEIDDDKERDQVLGNLLEYCKLDTYAMYAILNKLKKISN